MSEERLATELFIKAHLRQLHVKGIYATIAHKGDDWAGGILLHLNLLNGSHRLLSQVRDMDGKLAWLAIQQGKDLSLEEADAYIAKARLRDPDLWVIEIEDREGTNPFPGAIL